MQVDCQILAIGLGRQHDLLDKAADRLLGLFLALGIGEAADQLADAGPIGLRHRRMKPHRIRGSGGEQLTFQLLAAAIQLDHPVPDLFRRHPGDDRIDELLVIGPDLAHVSLQHAASDSGLSLQPVAFGRIFLAKDLHDLRIHQALFERIQNHTVQVFAPDHRHIGADRRAFLARGRTAKGSLLTLEKPASQQPQRISPENRNRGRRRSQTGMSVCFDFRAP
ncbi:hypothetical protein QWZ10_00065 [Paracoccus cavernae]|uniref:Uncharacterized protein n=1 Tax=Paracoccus cavernae TaxID=1571207 RepID=A0ABT8D5V8_9RHOB|nr:hypothetical protein [Paracoccus cavernae]